MPKNSVGLDILILWRTLDALTRYTQISNGRRESRRNQPTQRTHLLDLPAFHIHLDDTEDLFKGIWLHVTLGESSGDGDDVILTLKKVKKVNKN